MEVQVKFTKFQFLYIRNRFHYISVHFCSLEYINANFITVDDSHPSQYIATQGPLDHTILDFWQMIWENNCSVVIMLAKVIEAEKVQ
jgi:protein tyrosine phosphatase